MEFDLTIVRFDLFNQKKNNEKETKTIYCGTCCGQSAAVALRHGSALQLVTVPPPVFSTFIHKSVISILFVFCVYCIMANEEVFMYSR